MPWNATEWGAIVQSTQIFANNTSSLDLAEPSATSTDHLLEHPNSEFLFHFDKKITDTRKPKNLPSLGQDSQPVCLHGLFSAACGYPSRPITSRQTWHWNPACGCSQLHWSDCTGSSQRHCRFQSSLKTLQEKRAAFKACWNRQWCFLWSLRGLSRSCSSPLPVTFVQTCVSDLLLQKSKQGLTNK